MELYYNPDVMSDDEIRETFVGESRKTMLDDLLRMTRRQPDGAGVQHVVIQGPRGMGKTTLLLMLRMRVLESDLAEQWQPIKFPEELYGVSDLADLWLETLRLLGHDTKDPVPAETADSVREDFTEYKALHDGAFAALREWRRVHGKRLLLLIDNLDLLLDQIGDEQENARLRNLLMNDGTVMIVGGATSFFEEARAHDQPLYNFFQFYNVAGLTHEEVLDLLRRRAERDSIQDFECILQNNMARFRALEYFTAGSPRLVLMLYRVVTQSDFGEARKGLEKLLDEVTPYYKAKTEARPPQQRKILDHIARESARTHEAVTPSNIAAATRLPVNQVSAQLKRLAQDGYVRPANIRGRASYYALSEPLYAVWYQMRSGRNAREKMGWLVEFVRRWYERDEPRKKIRPSEDILRKALEEPALDALNLIRKAGLDEPLFPLVRALEYHTTHDTALIERLSPETREIVWGVVKALQEGAGEPS